LSEFSGWSEGQEGQDGQDGQDSLDTEKYADLCITDSGVANTSAVHRMSAAPGFYRQLEIFLRSHSIALQVQDMHDTLTPMHDIPRSSA
jgi:hypothetical protein